MHQHVALLLGQSAVLFFVSSSIFAVGRVPPIHHGWHYGDDYDHKAICKFYYFKFFSTFK
jgi:hypothetical protein